MKHPWVVFMMAAILEAGGDALVRLGMRSAAPARLLYWIVGALLLFAYGYSVNAPDWDFGPSLGLYVVIFFVVAQAISWIVFGQRPTLKIWVGGPCIVLGGLIISWKR